MIFFLSNAEKDNIWIDEDKKKSSNMMKLVGFVEKVQVSKKSEIIVT